MAMDPICGMNVNETTAISAVKDGITHYFCGEACRRKFLGLAPAPARHRALPFFCPMCEGVESETSGACPKCGMALESGEGWETDGQSELMDMARRFWIGLAFGLPVYLLAMAPMALPSLQHRLPPSLSRWIEFALATPVVLWCGRPFFLRAWHSLRTRNLNMFTLIALGTGVAYGASILAMLFPGLLPPAFKHHGEVPVYFEAASTIIVLVLLGQVLELRARRKTGDAIRSLIQHAPTTACVIHGNVEQEVTLDQVRPGDLIRVRPGGKIPVDGEIMEGHGSLDGSLLTGESVPEDAGPGFAVAAGTLTLTGSFILRAHKVGAETLFARIIHMVSTAQRSRAPIQKMADRAAAIFVPAVGVSALLTFIIWLALGPEPPLAYALVNAVSVLIVACPCALGLATPMAVMVGMGRGARAGILIREASVLGPLRKADTVVFDKTGTLTEGKLKVKTVEPPSVLALAAAVEIHSEHPIGKAIIREAQAQGLAWTPATAFGSIARGGVTGTVAGQRVVVGRIEESPAREDIQIAVTVEGNRAGTITLADQLRNGAPEAIQTLHAMGLRVVMLTGDNATVANAIARQLGIDEVHAGIRPAGKLELIRALKDAGRCVIMAGDGINDAPALAAADVGIAMGAGTDVALESAGIVLIRGDLRGIARAIQLGRLVTRNIRQNLIWAFAYNLAGLPIAAGALYPVWGILMSPMLAAAAMSFSSMSVMSNALRLRHIGLPPLK